MTSTLLAQETALAVSVRGCALGYGHAWSVNGMPVALRPFSTISPNATKRPARRLDRPLW